MKPRYDLLLLYALFLPAAFNALGNFSFGPLKFALGLAPICESPQFLCKNGMCINKVAVCDGTTDCSDNSDEEDCDSVNCESPTYYRCHNGTCISGALVCNHLPNCADGEDESNCQFAISTNQSAVPVVCPGGIQCPKGSCIKRKWLCDGQNDCEDGWDESVGCSALLLQLKCEDNEFLCANHHQCILKNLRCNGSPDCRDKSDEQNCDYKQLDLTNCTQNKGKFFCRDKFKCIDIRRTCDDKADCFDQSDEGGLCLKKNEMKCENCTHECLITPNGSVCICNKGYVLKKNNSCEDINECETYGICDQKCTNLPGSYSCSCDSNYVLFSNKRTCKIREGEGILMYSAMNKIRGIFLDKNVTFKIIDNLSPSIGVAAAGEFIYFTVVEKGSQAIMRTKEPGNVLELIVTSGLGTPEDLDVDWMTLNIYFTDAKYQYIGVCTNNGYACTILHYKNIQKPRDVALSPTHGLMFWSDWGAKPMISRSGMDGSNPIPFVSDNLIWPNGVIVDVPVQRIYWVDAKLQKIETIKFDQTGRRTVFTDSQIHPFSIAVFENRLYWSDFNGKEILSCDKFTGRDRRSLVRDPVNRLYGLYLHHHLLLTSEIINPCTMSSCSDMCLLAPGTNQLNYTCACPVNKKMVKGRCIETEPHVTVIAGHHNRLFIIEHKMLGRDTVEEISLDVVKIAALAYDSVSGSVLISDTETRIVYSYHLRKRQLSKMITYGLGHIRDIHYDEFGNNLYWCDWNSLTVETMSLKTLARKTIFNGSPAEAPIDITLVPDRGFMFVALIGLSRSFIDRLSMDGMPTSRKQIVEVNTNGDDMKLHFDRETNRLFWTNGYTGEIESADIDGKNRINLELSLSRLASLTSAGGILFWSRMGSATIYRSNLKEEDRSEYLKLKINNFGFGEIELTAITKPTNVNSPCLTNNGNCSHLCLMSHISSSKRVCACPTGFVLSIDYLTCKEPKKCSSNEYQCYTGECIPRFHLCDKSEDCPHGDDERLENCDATRCPGGQFLCHDRKHCIDVRRRCDGHVDCVEDRSDEICNSTCNEKQFWCESGECISEQFRCDGKVDCRDAQDELNCSQVVCGAEKFRCKSGQCIPKEWQCDTEPDCVDGSDEYDNCLKGQCRRTEFRCSNNRCVDTALTCNGHDECGDGSDEFDCKNNPRNNYHHIFKICNEQTEFYCSLSKIRCLPISARCNGVQDCPNGEDEKDCSSNPCISAREFYCRKGRKCIPREWLCDGNNDCGDNSDEIKSVCMLKPVQGISCTGFTCKNGACVPFINVCNNVTDCTDNSDEGGNCGITCEKFGCTQKCFQTPKGPNCSCKNGYKLGNDNKTCVDVNECDLEICSQKCININGSFTCSCSEPEFVLRSDHVSCKVRGNPLMYVAASDAELTVLSNNLKHKQDVNLGSNFFRTIRGLDVGVQNNYIYLLLEDDELFKIKVTNGSIDMNSDHRLLPQITNFAYDWITDNIYYIESHVSLRIINFNVPDRGVSLYNTHYENYMWALSLDPATGYIFWFESSRNVSVSFGSIKRAECSGENVQIILSELSYGIRQLVVDSFGQQIYWLDRNQNIITRMNYDGTGVKTVAQTDDDVVMFTYFESSIYWVISGTMDFSIKKCKIHGLPPRKCEIIKLNLNHIQYLSILQENRQRRVANPCANTKCPVLCTNTPNGAVFLHVSDGKKLIKHYSCDESEALRIYSANYVGRAGIGTYIAYVTILCLILGVITIAYLHYFKPKSEILHRLHFRTPYIVPSTSTSITHDNLDSGTLFFENPLCQETSASRGKKLSVQKDNNAYLETVPEELINLDSSYTTSKESLIPK